MKLKYLLLTFCLSWNVFAQKESLHIGPGDQITIKVFDTPELDETTQVSDIGDVSLMLGGSLRVANMTTDQAARAVEGVLVSKQIMHDPKVLVTVHRYATQNVTVFGQVERPSSYEIDTPRYLVDVLALAGGFTSSADHHITIERADGRPVDTVFVSNDPRKNEVGSTLVFPGDRVIVPKSNLVYVLGDVGRAGGYPMNNNESGLTVLQAVADAGGVPPSASPNHARLVRHLPDGSYKELQLPLGKMQKGKGEDLKLQADDIIYVPFSYLRNSYLGLTSVVASAAGAAVYAR